MKEMNEIYESRREWIKRIFAFEARRIGRAKNYKIWKDDNHAIWMLDIDIWNTINNTHNNPFAEEIVDSPSDYDYSCVRV